MTTAELSGELAMARGWTDKTAKDDPIPRVPKDAEARYLAVEAELAERFASGWVMTGNRVSHEGRIS